MALILAGIVAALALVAALRWTRRHYLVVTVDGTSMAPTLGDSDRVVVRRRRIDQVQRGDIVVLEPPASLSGRYQPVPAGPGRRVWNIKRAVALPGDPVPAAVVPAAGVHLVPHDAVVVLGDNPDSVDSRQRGLFPADRLLGVAVRRLSGPADRPISERSGQR